MFEQVPPEKRLGYLDQQLNQKRQIKLKTCADVYDHWRNCKRSYKKAPKDGVEFQVDYIDTGLALNEEIRKKVPIVLALHGAPGSYHDFALLIHHLSQQNVRVIAPNFPDNAATVKMKVLFRHSADEKAAYLRDFLGAINVNKIDLLISHSSAIFPTLLILLNANSEAIAKRKRQQSANNQTDTKDDENRFKDEIKVETQGNVENNDDDEDEQQFHDAQGDERLCNCTEATIDASARLSYKENCSDNFGSKSRNKGKRNVRSQEVIVQFEQPIDIKAVALLNPAGHRLPKSMKPTWFKCGSVRIYQHKLGRSLVRKLGPAFLSVVGTPVRVDNMDNVMLSASVMRNSKCQRVVQQLEQLSQLKMPTLLVFSENDKLIEKEIFYEMTQFMKLDQKNFDVFNNDGDVELSQSLIDDWIRVMVFKAGGHYAYSNYAKTVNKAVSELLQKVVEKPLTKTIPIESC